MDIQGLVTTFEQVLSRLNKDPVQLMRTFYLIIAASVAIVNAFPPLQSRFIHYGARATKIKDEHGKPVDSPESKGLFSWFLDYLVVFQVPHSWFIHFYVVSVASSIFWAIELVRKGPIFNFLAEQHMENSSNEPSMTFNQVVLTWMLMAIQGSRRLYECITLRKPSTSKMAGPAWILGILFYLAMGITIWAEGIPSLLGNDLPSQSLGISQTPSLKTIIGVPLFILASSVQHDCHKYLASLKKYSLPEGKIFRNIISPHYTSECLIYFSIAIVAAPAGQPLNKSVVMALFFETINLGITAESTRAWYCQKFGPRSVEGRWRMFPYIY